MKLQRLHIDLNVWGEQKDQYTGTAIFGDEDTKIEISITPEAANQLLEVCASGLVDAATQTANTAKDNILHSVALIEHKVEQAQ